MSCGGHAGSSPDNMVNGTVLDRAELMMFSVFLQLPQQIQQSPNPCRLDDVVDLYICFSSLSKQLPSVNLKKISSQRLDLSFEIHKTKQRHGCCCNVATQDFSHQSSCFKSSPDDYDVGLLLTIICIIDLVIFGDSSNGL